MRAAFGKVNTLHNHVLPWADRPLVTENLVGGEEGIERRGRLGRAADSESAGCSSRRPGRSSAATRARRCSRSSKRGDLSYVGHLRGYQDIRSRPTSTSACRTRAATTPSGIVDGVDIGRFTTSLWGIDATVRWRPLQRSIYHSFVGRSEVDLEPARSAGRAAERPWATTCRATISSRAAGSPGVRFDRSDRADDASLFDTGQSVMLTYWPSEFSQVRGQYRRTDVRRRPDGQRVAVPVPVLDRRARRASVLDGVG